MIDIFFYFFNFFFVLSRALCIIVCQTQRGYTALIWAAHNNHSDCLIVLVESGADKDTKDSVRRIEAC